MRRLVLLAAGALAVGGGLLAPATAASAVTTTVVADWEMNEPAGSTTLVDKSANRLNGTIGTSITLNGAYQTFPHVVRGDGGTVDPQHLDIIKSPKLNPGTADFVVRVRLKIPTVVASYGNVMQKGQTGTAGGFWKIQLDGGQGRVLCDFISPSGSGGIRNPVLVADNQWHTVTCERGPGYVSTTVDGVVARINHTTGAIANTAPLSIGGKASCNATHHHDCDYFIGSIDWVRVSTRS